MTHTRTHVFVAFANPHLHCRQCDAPAPRWHDERRCGCEQRWWLEPCGHRADTYSTGPDWSPVDSPGRQPDR